MNMSFKLWTRDEEAALRTRYLRGEPISSIARSLRRSEAACASKIDRLRDDRGEPLPMRNPAGAVRP
jgi:hypothetical protein